MPDTPAADAPRPQAAAAPAVEFVKIVNTGNADAQIMAGPAGLLLKKSQNSLLVPKELGAKLMRAYPYIKDINSIFPDSVNAEALKAENAALKKQAAALQGLLNQADQAKGADSDIKAQLADALAKLADFQGAKNKADLDAVKAQHADAAAAPAAVAA